MDVKKEVQRLDKKVRKWSKEWVLMPVMIKNHRDEPPINLEAYIAGEEDYPSTVEIESLNAWHFVNYMNGVLNEGKDSLEDFALAARYANAVVRFEEAFANNNQGGSLLLDTSVIYYSLNVLAGWQSDARMIGMALYKGLDTRLLDLRHTDRHEAGKVYPWFWFLIHLFCQSEGLKLNTSLYSYPDDMSPYEEVLSDWRTTDMEKVKGFVSMLANAHVRETKPYLYDEALMDQEDRMIFPYEILCWLRLREWAGLPNPETYDHPLMNQPLAKMPEPVPLPKPETPLLDKVIEKFKKEYPGSFEEPVKSFV